MAKTLRKRALELTDGIGLTRQIAKTKLQRFIASQATEGFTLDLGCGLGPYAPYFPNRVGFDSRPSPAVDVLGDAHDLRAFRSESFDCVLCTEVLEHLRVPRRALDEIHRVLKTGGTAILTTRFVFPLHDVPHDYYRYTKYGLRHLLEKFTIVELREEVDTLGAMAVLCQRIGGQCRTLYFLPFGVFWYALARVFQGLSFAITKEYGQYGFGVEESNILTSGYHVVCRKP